MGCNCKAAQKIERLEGALPSEFIEEEEKNFVYYMLLPLNYLVLFLKKLVVATVFIVAMPLLTIVCVVHVFFGGTIKMPKFLYGK